MRVFPDRPWPSFTACTVGDAAGELTPLTIEDAHHIRGNEMVLDAHHSGRQQASFPVSDGLLCTLIDNHAATHVSGVGDPTALPANAPRGEKSSSCLFPSKNTVHNGGLLAIGNHRHASAMHGNVRGCELGHHAAPSMTRWTSGQGLQLLGNLVHHRDYFRPG